MNRREFLRNHGVVCAGLALTRAISSPALPSPSAGWRTFDVVTKVELLNPKGVSSIWLPAALVRDTPYQRTLLNHYTAPGGTAALTKDKESALGIVSASYPANSQPVLTLTSRISLKNYVVDLGSIRSSPRVPLAELNYFLQPSRYVPTDGIVRDRHEGNRQRHIRYRQSPSTL